MRIVFYTVKKRTFQDSDFARRRVACKSDALGETRLKGLHFRAALSQLRGPWSLCAGCPSIALFFSRLSSHLLPASSTCPCWWLVAGCEQFSVSRFLRVGSFAARGSHNLVCTPFQRESCMSSNCNMPSIFTGNDVVLEFVLRILRHADVALLCAHCRCGELLSAPIASSWFVLFWRDEVF